MVAIEADNTENTAIKMTEITSTAPLYLAEAFFAPGSIFPPRKNALN
jgi:hypothetical protein